MKKDFLIFITMVAGMAAFFFIMSKVMEKQKQNQMFCKNNPKHERCLPVEEDDTCILTDSCMVDAIILDTMFGD